MAVKTNGLYYTYAHLKSIPINIKNGVKINLGDTLGVMGCTGRCNGDHLHLQIKNTLSSGPTAYNPGPDFLRTGWLP